MYDIAKLLGVIADDHVMRLWRSGDKFILHNHKVDNATPVTCADIISRTELKVSLLMDGYAIDRRLILPSVNEILVLVSAAEALGLTALHYLYQEYRTFYQASTHLIVACVRDSAISCSINDDYLCLDRFDQTNMRVRVPLSDNDVFESVRLELLEYYHGYDVIATR